MKESGIIFDIKKFAIHDGPGIRTTVFFKGCPLRCVWCHNPEGQKQETEAMEGKEGIGREMTVDQLMQEIEKDRIFYEQSGGGVTFSGGEPLMQPVFLERMLFACKEAGIHSAVDTSGYTSEKTFERFPHIADIFLYDLKIMDDVRHREYTGVSNAVILKNLTVLDTANTPIHIRFCAIPGITDTSENIAAVARFVRSLNHVQEINVLPYHALAREKYRKLGRNYHLNQIDTNEITDSMRIKSDFEQYGFTVTMGG